MWHVGFNDDTPIGWTITAAYAATTIAAALAARRDRRSSFWRGVALVTLLFGINKQLDLQTPFLHFGRRGLEAMGIVRAHAVFRAVLLAVLAVCGVVAVVFFARLSRDARGARAIALAGLAGLAVFVVMRAAEFNHVGRYIAGGILGSKGIAAGLELGSLLLVFVGALRARVR